VSKAQIVTVVITLLVPVVTAVAGILGVMFQDRQVQRSQAGRRRLALEDAHRQVTFAADWWNASKLIADSPEAVQEATACAAAWLERASAGVSGLEMPVTDEKRRITFRRLLLFYPLQGLSANILRGIFYLLLAILTLGTGATITDVLESPALAAGEDISPWIYTALAVLIFRFWAVSAQNRRSGKRERQPGKIRIALLLYRLGGISASLVRIAFYASVAVAIWWLSTTVDSQNDAKQLPHDITRVIVAVGLAVGVRHWAVSLGTAGKIDKTNRQQSSYPATQVTDSPLVENSWPPVPGIYPDHRVP
jgi:hypothetical protein